ncbi:MAG: nickel-responsive transcriptional regulator NikR [Gammaproteobacteria bacterium]|nr:nickel-responsive transcriptional regulator NikR [Gammaproteobacteria bacterium]
MERFTISLDDDLAQQFDAYIHAMGYSNRSEAVRDLIRFRLENERIKSTDGGHCVAALSYVYNHHESELAAHLTRVQHDHHDLALSTMHTHLDHDNCLEVTLLHGPINEVRQFGNAVIAERGVRHGNLHVIPVEHEETAHHDSGRAHVHARPLT